MKHINIYCKIKWKVAHWEYVMRIVFLGDSLTWGGYGGNFVDEVQKQMPEYDIINAGVGGDTVVNLMRRVEDVLAEHEPDAMFVMIGGNDATSYSQPKTRNYYRKAKQLEEGFVTPEEFESTYHDLLLKIKSFYVLPLIGLAPTEYSRELVEARHDYNERARKVADGLDVPVLDLDAIFTPENPIEREPVEIGFIQQIGDRANSGWDDYESERQKWGYTYTFDGMHILPATAVEFAKHIVPFLKKHLE
jgi:lysophospholipase L1-like esterase